jgi:hypothetical protein
MKQKEELKEEEAKHLHITEKVRAGLLRRANKRRLSR